IGSQTRLDLDQAMGSCQQADQGVVEFVGWAILDRLLPNLHGLLNWFKHLLFSQLDANGGQSGAARKLFGQSCGRFVHDDAPPLARFSLYDRYGSSSFFWQAPLLWLSATNWGQI